MASIEVLNSESIRIGRRLYRLDVSDNPLPDGSLLNVDAATSPISEHQDTFRLDDLREVIAKDLPNDFCLSVYEPRLSAKEIDYLVIRKISGQPQLLISTKFYYQDWIHPTNLLHFCKELSEALCKHISGCVESKMDQDEYGISNWITASLPENSDLFVVISKADYAIRNAIRDLTLRLAVAPTTTPAVLAQPVSAQPVQSLKPDEAGYKWWVRYVVIPLLAGSTILALVKLGNGS